MRDPVFRRARTGDALDLEQPVVRQFAGLIEYPVLNSDLADVM